jgi:hypothetical protein
MAKYYEKPSVSVVEYVTDIVTASVVERETIDEWDD